MDHTICATCGTRFPASRTVPDGCPICLDERQYLPPQGQRWTTMSEVARDHRPRIEELEPGLHGIGTEPAFAIGQRALLLRTDEGNVLWDCVTLLDDETVSAVEALGGIDLIAISHPHYYSSMVAWARAFDARILLHESERGWVVEPDERVGFWEGDLRALPGGLSLLRLGGHFPGSQILLWPGGAGGRGALLTGDTVMVAADPAWVSFMYSYPNFIPLPAREVERMGRVLDGLAFDRIYGAWWERVVLRDGQAVVRRSVKRYLDALEGRLHPLRGPSPTE